MNKHQACRVVAQEIHGLRDDQMFHTEQDAECDGGEVDIQRNQCLYLKVVFTLYRNFT